LAGIEAEAPKAALSGYLATLPAIRAAPAVIVYECERRRADLPRTARLDPAARDGPEPGTGLVPALDHQQSALTVRHDGAYAGDDRSGHADKYLLCH
jgi:hypothetical protein